jgi:translocation and assembly module TamB
VIVMQSDWFKNRVRGEIVRVTEDATGGRVEIGSFQYDWRSLTAQVGPFVLHGTEAAGSPPLFRAARIEVGLKVISLFERRVDLASLSVEKPEVHVFVGADGATNFPVPKRANPEAIVQQLFDLKVRRFVLHDGYAQYNSSRIPLDATGESLSSSFAYERGPRYVGMLDAQRICFERPGRSQAEFSLHSKLALEPNRLTLSETRLALSRTKLELSGTIEDLAALRGRFDVRAVSTLKDLEPVLALPASAAGDLNFEGNLSLRVFPTLDYSFAGKVTARNFSYAQAKIRVAGVAFATPIKLSPARLDFADLRVSALGGAIRGHLLVDGGTSLRFEGQANAISVPEALRLETGRDIALTGTVSGPLQVESVISHSGLENIHANARLELAPGEGGVPLGGNIDVQYDESSGRLEIADSDLRLGTSHLQASGVLGEQLSVHFTSNNLEDLLAAFPLVGQKPPEKPLVALKGGAAKFDGSITGILNRPRISGHVDLPRFQFLGREFDRLSGTVELTQSALTLRKASLQQGTARAEGDGEFGLVDWLPVDSSAISGKFAARGVDLQHVAAEAGLKVPVTGTASTVVAVEGTVSSPRATASIQAENIVAYQEHIDGVHANVIISADSIQASEAEMTLGAGRITLKGVYRHSHDDWSSGQIQFETASHGLTVQQFEHLRARYQTLSGQVDWKAGGKLQLVKGDVQQSDAAAELSLRNASFKGRPYGSLTLTANTHDAALDLHLRANLNATSIEGSGQ